MGEGYNAVVEAVTRVAEPTNQRICVEHFLTRYSAFFAIIIAFFVSVVLGLYDSAWWFVAALLFGALTLLRIADLLQPRQAIRRTYPVLGNLRYFFALLRPEMRQYFFEN